MRELLCEAMRAAEFRWPAMDEATAQGFYAFAREHGMHLLLAARVSEHGGGDCPPVLRDRLMAALRAQAAVEETARRELKIVLIALQERGVVPVLFKGTALAYTQYPDPVLRPRFDTDALIAAHERDAVRETLERCGYRRPPFSSGELITYQEPFQRVDERGIPHAIDVHWRISNPQVLSQALTVEQVRSEAEPIPMLGDPARAARPSHALAVACIHRVAHHSGEERLIWLYDIHLIAQRLSWAEADRFVSLVHSQELRTVCAQGLSAALKCFRGTRITPLLARLYDGGQREEPSAIYAAAPMRKVDVLVSDLKALGGWRPKIRLLREHVLPPADYMRQTYGVSSSALLPLLYVWRVARGAAGWLRR